MHRNLLIYFYLVFAAMCLYAEGNSLKIVMPWHSKGWERDPTTYEIATDESGIISLVIINKQDIYAIEKKDNAIYINDENGNSKSAYIITYGADYVSRTWKTDKTTERKISIYPTGNLVYRENDLECSTNSIDSVSQKFVITTPSIFSTYNFVNNTLFQSYMRSDNVVTKRVYKIVDDTIEITTYQNQKQYNNYTYDNFDELGGKTIISGKNIHSEDRIVNVINWLICFDVASATQEVLFPVIFLKDFWTSARDWQYTASSFLSERNAMYSPGNLSKKDGIPWASTNGYGIGDKIIIDMANKPTNKLILINGFVSPERPDLFIANSRARQIKITNQDNGRSKTVPLQDTKDMQTIDISDLLPTRYTMIEIEIVSVYEGSKYKDLCIQAILPE
ncbi:hypothetical protein FACS189485_15720 [Spirochaetia bacterium]|nr:hypothetical protein FACS189485_15720 [Spirochaetia bacterium]